MALEEVQLQLDPSDLPQEATRIIAESDARIDELFATEQNKRVPKYFPSDPELFYRALDCLTREDIPLGRVFCEWGSGFGVCTCLAALLGYEAYGIEIEPPMVRASRDFANDLGIDVTIVPTSYVPEGYESCTSVGGEFLIRDDYLTGHSPEIVSELAYDGMEREIADIDVFFVYPWPMEQDFMRELFDEIAVEGAILLTYHKSGEIYANRKIHTDFGD